MDKTLMNTWSSETQSFIIHTVSVPRPNPLPAHQTTMIIDRDIAALLPTSFNPLPENIYPLAFQVRETEHKGKGMFATRDIPVGSLIFAEHPAIIMPAVIPFDRDSSIHQGIAKVMPPSQRQQLLAMANCKSEMDCRSHEEGIAATNATSIELPIPLSLKDDPIANDYGAVSLIINRANHSCGPNAAQKWDLESFSTSLYALRDIAIDEEIQIIYTDVTASRAVRMQTLSRYGFTCDCPYCCLSNKVDIAQSDLDRAELGSWNSLNLRYASWASDLCRADDALIISHQRALALIEKEGMQGMHEPFVEEIALSYAQLGDEEAFKVWVAKLIALCSIQNPHKAAEYRCWSDNPRKMAKWGWRAKQKQQTSRKHRNRESQPEDIDGAFMLELLY